MYHNQTENVYPGHTRTPNVLVRGLYSVGFFIADFGPLLVNLFNAIYGTIRKLFSFLVGLLIEISTVVVLVGTIAFSVFHSLELLRRGGAAGGLEYVGVIMFEIVFVSSVAMMTKSFMNGEKPDWYSWAGFAIGFLFVEWSNITGMTQNWTGWIIGFFTPILLIIAEGIIAYSHRDQFKNHDTKTDEKMVLVDVEKSIEPAPELMEENRNEETRKPVTDVTILEEEQKKSQTDESMYKQEESTETSDESKPEIGENRKFPDIEGEGRSDEKADEYLNQSPGEMTEETKSEPDQSDHQTDAENGENLSPELLQKPDEIQTEKAPSKPKKPVKKSTSSEEDQEAKKMKTKARKWATKFYNETGTIPGRVRIVDNTHCKDGIAREVAAELKQKYEEKAS